MNPTYLALAYEWSNYTQFQFYSPFFILLLFTLIMSIVEETLRSVNTMRFLKDCTASLLLDLLYINKDVSLNSPFSLTYEHPYLSFAFVIGCRTETCLLLIYAPNCLSMSRCKIGNHPLSETIFTKTAFTLLEWFLQKNPFFLFFF